MTKENNEKTTSGTNIRMKLKQLQDCDRIAARRAYNETSQWYAKNPGKTMEEVIKKYEKLKKEILQSDFYSINGLKSALTDKSANL